MKRRTGNWILLGWALTLLHAGTVAAAEGPAFTCGAYTDTAARIVTTDLVNQQLVITATAATPQGTYASICLPSDAAALVLGPRQPQLVVTNTGTAPLLIENLYVHQTSVPRCEPTAAVCPSVILRGPIVLRSPRLVNLRGENIGVDGFSIQSDDVTIDVSPDRLRDPTYATSAHFRYGIVVEQGNHAALDRPVIRRDRAQVGSAGIYLMAGEGHIVRAPRTYCVDTGLVAMGGSAEENLVLGGTFDGNTVAGESCNAHAGVFLQGDRIFVRSTETDPVSIANFQQGVILDPLQGPMGIESGTVSNGAVGVTIRNATIATLPAIATHVTQFRNIQRRFDFGTL